MKKTIVFCMAALLAVSSLSGCASSKTGTDGKKLETVTWLVPVQEQEDSKLIVAEANKIIEPAIGATLDMKFIDSGAYSERMKMNMASGNSYDLCFTSHWLNVFVTAGTNGSLYDISDLITDDLKAKIPDYALNAAKIGGKLYAVPNVQVMTNPLALKVQKRLVEKYNLDLSTIKTVEDIEPFLQTIKENEPDLYPYRTKWGTEPWLAPKYTRTGGAGTTNIVLDKEDGKKALLVYETDEYKRAHQKLREWFNKGYIRADGASVGDDSTDSKLGKYAVEIDGWAPGAEATSAAKGIEWEFVTLHRPFMEMKGPRAAMTAIGADSKNPELAMKLIELVNEDKQLYNLFCYGLEDKHYTLNDEGKLVNGPEVTKYQPTSDWVFGNQFNAYLREGMSDTVWEETEKMNNEALVSPIFTFEEDITPYKSEVAQIASVNSEYENTLLYIKSDEEYENRMNEYISKLEAAGQQKVLTELQKQLDAYWANQQ